MKIINAIFIILAFHVNTLWALPWFQHKLNAVKSESADSSTNESVNFSGVWEGECDNTPAIDITIHHQGDHIKISYGFFTEQYDIGSLEGSESAKIKQSMHATTLTQWNKDHSALVFINSAHYLGEAESFHSFFSRVTMTKKNNQLLIEGTDLQTSAMDNEISQTHMSCIYHQN
ncbi:hypothetical protein [Legionella worsleiensis]|uniref:Uncharacterized protein n=1 Tax=Legionella worsleiensis TaxID=45076 RepID=A0A0W1A6B2_9GAMM|nr:hypothetical protein [Legionella worsleiensis]KTD76894.1 hypothetical protein Lwor_2119 [Legionella worsleiensis]STY33436.1 Uncharacterised protein [Legionella worsleiensis]